MSKHLVLSHSVAMCSGVCCKKKNSCYRYKLNEFFDVIASMPHPDPYFVEPCSGECRKFLPIVYQDAKTKS